MKKLLVSAVLCFLILGTCNASAEDTKPISEGRDYSLITPASTAYPDDGIKLTDGIFGTIPDGKTSYYSSNSYVGFNKTDVDGNGNFVIILDLGKTVDVSSLSLGFLNETSAGIYAPRSVEFAISKTRNGKYNSLGSVKTEKSTVSSASETYAASLDADRSGRFVRVTVTPLTDFIDDGGEIVNADWTFIDEISVFGTVSADTSDDTNGKEPFADGSADGDSKPETGDSSVGIIVFILLAVSAVTMMFALFTNKKEKDF